MPIKLNTAFCGVECSNPFFLAASPVTRTADMIMRAFDAGWAGAVTKSLWTAQDLEGHSISPRFAAINHSSHKHGMGNLDFRIDKSLKECFHDLSRVKKAFPHNILVISLKAEYSAQSWRNLARRAEDTGADMIELCLSCPDGDPAGGSIGQNPAKTAEVIAWVRASVQVPVIVKLTPNISDLYPVAIAAQESGANALTAINTARAIAGVDLNTLCPLPTVAGKSSYSGYSGTGLKPIALRFVAELASHSSMNLPIAGTGGINTWSDAAEFLLLGSSIVQVATAVMLRGYGIINELTAGLAGYMEQKGFQSVEEMVGKSLPMLQKTSDLDSGLRMLPVVNENLCLSCGGCHTSCRDGGYAAIDWKPGSMPKINAERCTGCGLCALACRVSGCITLRRREERCNGSQA